MKFTDILLGLGASALLLCTTGTTKSYATETAGEAPPKLIVFMAVDGFPQEQLVKYYDQYGKDGFRLLLDKGAWYGNNHYSHATTYTGVGHATLLSCAHPYKHGVIGNDWIDRKTRERVYSTQDNRYKYLDEETSKHAGTSPFNIKVTAVGDELKYANSQSKVIAIAGKDRSAIGLAGQNGTAYMHSTKTGRFITSNYYMPDYPEWWKAYYKDKPQDKYFGQQWTLLLPEEAYARSAPDDRPWSTNYKGLGTKFPHPISGGANEPSKSYYDAMIWSPYGDNLMLDFAKAAIKGENLGNNPAGVPDLLALSWTSHDYANHLFGPESRQSHDQTVRLDRVFAELFEFLDQEVGLDNVIITLSADHGFMNIPEFSASRNLDAGRIDPEKLIEATNTALSEKYGEGKYIMTWWNPNLYLDYDLVDSKNLDREAVENTAQRFLRSYPGVEAVFTRTQLEEGRMPNTKLAKQVTLAWHQQISGDIVIMNKPNWYLFAKPTAYASTHGSPWSYDTNVPLVMYGPKWIKAGKYGDSETVDLARTLAFILNVRPPNGCEGRVLSEALQ
ncbi:alkaline phosphatase family protein [Filomicrobium sp.]|uniref:alkaline phosphatase family protein n=1 Tax=Filomicrobium sp. TaxID=2024831 RepID=UPI00258E4ECB|nr:alkaline phosphatase family protein [Filomicrobium sp.]MCV0370769.1 alkaline phosphatase family protein [Filomicrobium sp.]